jgi:hypothetical protein
MNSTTCAWYKDGGSPWLVDDEFSTGLLDPSTKQIDLYYGFEDRDNIQNTDYIMDFENAVATVTSEGPAPDTPQEPPPPAPDTSINSASTAGLTNGTTATFGFSSNDPAASFECKLDGAAFGGCASPKEYPGLAEGQHTFEVRAKNAGGTDDTPASKTWTVDTTAPKVAAATPTNNATGVARSTDLTAAYSEAVNPSTVTTSTFTLVKDWSTTRISGGVGLSPDGKTATFNPHGSSTTNLARCTKYKAAVTTGVKDVAGNPLAAKKVWYFKTTC